jgi:hypothetical protein
MIDIGQYLHDLVGIEPNARLASERQAAALAHAMSELIGERDFDIAQLALLKLIYASIKSFPLEHQAETARQLTINVGSVGLAALLVEPAHSHQAGHG